MTVSAPKINPEFSVVLLWLDITALADWLTLQDVAGKSMNAEGLSKSRFHPVHKGPEATLCRLTGNLLGVQTSTADYKNIKNLL